MEAMYFLLPISLVLVVIVLCVLVWATSSGQFDDLQAPGERMLMDDDGPPEALAKTPTQEAPAAEDPAD